MKTRKRKTENYFDVNVIANVNKCNLDKNSELTNLDNNPLLKTLLENYIRFKYEESSDTSEDSLWREYLYLKDNGELNNLFIQESIDNTFGL